jgi:hypothetical protein
VNAAVGNPALAETVDDDNDATEVGPFRFEYRQAGAILGDDDARRRRAVQSGPEKWPGWHGHDHHRHDQRAADVCGRAPAARWRLVVAHGQGAETRAQQKHQLERAGRSQRVEQDPAGDDGAQRAAEDVRREQCPDAPANVREIRVDRALHERKAESRHERGRTDHGGRQQHIQPDESLDDVRPTRSGRDVGTHGVPDLSDDRPDIERVGAAEINHEPLEPSSAAEERDHRRQAEGRVGWRRACSAKNRVGRRTRDATARQPPHRDRWPGKPRAGCRT